MASTITHVSGLRLRISPRIIQFRVKTSINQANFGKSRKNSWIAAGHKVEKREAPDYINLLGLGKPGGIVPRNISILVLICCHNKHSDQSNLVYFPLKVICLIPSHNPSLRKVRVN